MADVKLRLTADTGQATKGISGFRKDPAELVRAVEKPLRQIDALQKTQESAKAASTEFFTPKKRVDELKLTIAAAQADGKALKAILKELD